MTLQTEEKDAAARRFFDRNGSTYDLVVHLFTLGWDVWWKRRMIAMVPAHARRILDQACGTGILTLALAHRFPRARVTGVDRCEEYLRIARRKAAADKQGARIEWLLGRAEQVRPRGEFDVITSSYLAKYARLPALIHHARDMLRAGGVLILHDFTQPHGRRNAVLWTVYCAMMRGLGGLLFPRWRLVFEELPAFLRQSGWVDETVELLRAHDFQDITVEYLTLQTSAMVVARKPAPAHPQLSADRD